MKHFGTKLCLLLWKNWKMQQHQPWQTTMLLLMTLSVLPVLYVRSILPAQRHTSVTVFEAYDPGDILTLMLTKKMGIQLNTRKESKEIAWSPKKSSSESFTDDSRSLITKAVSGLFALREFSSEEELETYLQSTANLGGDDSPGDDPITLAGVVFADIENPDDPKLCSKRLKITLRFPSELRMGACVESDYNILANWKTDELFPLISTAGSRGNEGRQSQSPQYGPCPYYTLEGFTLIQTLLTRALVERCVRTNQSNQTPSYLLLRRFSYPEYTGDRFHEVFSLFTVIFPMFGLSISFGVTLKDVTIEKEHKIKETMKIMGLPTVLHWIGWFITTMAKLLIAIGFYVLIYKLKTEHGAVLNESSGSVFLVLLLLSGAAQTCFVFLLSVFFSKANVAEAIGGFLLTFVQGVFMIIDYKYDSIDVGVKILSCSLFTCAFGIGLKMMTLRERAGRGQHWSNLWEPVMLGESLTFGIILIMLFVDCIIYVLITLYIEAIYPGEYGVPKPWYFIFQKSFWRPEKPTMEEVEDAIVHKIPANFEAEPRQSKAGIQIRNITKEFPGKILAVQDLSLNVYENQITVIVGQNGAGKTTTLSMLTGMFSSTHGTALVNGYDIRKNIAAARESLGFCPQHNVLFNELTVQDHLYFFGKLKGLSGKELKDEIDHFVELIQLQRKRNTQARKLSGGMKRKLSAGIALCGKPKVVIFDEPTSGMDPTARRALWDLLRDQKAGRTILITTHFMDEADLLGDRIAILAGGQLQCCGTPFFLKKRYGAGYRLAVVKGPRCKASEVTGVLARHMPGLAVSHELGSELSYQLDESRAASFERMFKDLEQEREALGIINFGVSLTTMEDVFLKAIKIHNDPPPPVTASQMVSAGPSTR